MKITVVDAVFGLVIVLSIAMTVAMFARARGHIAATQAYIQEMNR